MARFALLITLLATSLMLQGCQTMEHEARSGIRTTWHKANRVDGTLKEYLW